MPSQRQDGASPRVAVWIESGTEYHQRLPSQFLSPPCSYGGGSFSFSNLIQAVTRRFSTEYELEQVRSREPGAHPQSTGVAAIQLPLSLMTESGLHGARPPSVTGQAGCLDFLSGDGSIQKVHLGISVQAKKEECQELLCTHYPD